MISSKEDKEALLSATNWAAASFLGIFLPLIGLIFAAIAGSKADKLNLKHPLEPELKKVRMTALAGGLTSVLSLILYVFYFS